MSESRSAFLYCVDPMECEGVQDVFKDEADVVARTGAEIHLLNHGAAQHNHIDRALLRVPNRVGREPKERTLIYRGWMVHPRIYEALHRGLLARGWRLVNTPEAYLNCHWYPNAFQRIGEAMSPSLWMELQGLPDWDDLMKRLAVFGDVPILLKDYSKSEKHYWNEACFIPSAQDRSAVERVVTRFLDLRGDDLEQGLVFRKYEPLEVTGPPGKLGFPSVREYRLFFIDGELLASSPYWEGATNESADLPIEFLETLVPRLETRFLCLDIARTAGGRWLIIETGDGQVSGVPSLIDPEQFFSRLIAGVQSGLSYPS